MTIMSPFPPLVPDRFGSAVPFYVAHRLRYPAALVDEVAGRTGLTSRDRVLDLGSGPGFLAIAFAARAGEVVGMDPDPAMLAAARREADAAGVRVRFVEGSSFDLSPSMGPFRLVTMGRSFHWMDRVATLRALDAIVAPGGAVALFGDSHEKARENSWREVLKEVARAFAGASVSEGLRTDPAWDSHPVVLLDSAFAQVARCGIVERRRVSVEEIVGRALSMSATAPQVLGARTKQFMETLRDRLLALSPDGVLSEVVEFSATIGRRAA
jgi:SAM-dependent methyltransferase